MDKSAKEELPDAIAKQYEFVKEFCPDLLLVSVLDAMPGTILSNHFQIPAMVANLQTLVPSSYLRSPLNEPYFHKSSWMLMYLQVYKQNMEVKLPIIREKMGHVLGATLDRLWPNFDAFMLETFDPIAPSVIGFSETLFKKPKDWP